MTWSRPKGREIVRLRRDSELLLAMADGDARRRDERAARAAIVTERLEAVGAPDAGLLGESIVRCVGARLTVPPRRAQDLGYAVEVALAGQSAFARESDFGAWEIKANFGGIGASYPMRLFGWRAPIEETKPLSRLTSLWLGRPMLLAAEPGTAGLIVGDRILAARNDDGEIVWRRTMETIRRGAASSRTWWR
jgi:hypothetical protein